MEQTQCLALSPLPFQPCNGKSPRGFAECPMKRIRETWYTSRRASFVWLEGDFDSFEFRRYMYRWSLAMHFLLEGVEQPLGIKC